MSRTKAFGPTLVVCLAFCLSTAARGFELTGNSEPKFCDPKNFAAYEKTISISNLERAHIYKIGDLTLVGLGIGASDYHAVQRLAKDHGVTDAKSCTWYLNQGNDAAAVAFNHDYVPAPYLQGPNIASKYEKILATAFDKDPHSMLDCALNHHYVAMGCDGMRHRGPSVFAMFLAYAGCTPEHATAIVNKIWGSNFVSTATREAIAEAGAHIESRNPAGRAELLSVMVK